MRKTKDKANATNKTAQKPAKSARASAGQLSRGKSMGSPSKAKKATSGARTAPKPKQKKKIGRPPKPIKMEDLQKLAGIQCTVRQAASWFELSERQFRDRLKRDVRLRMAWIVGKEKGRADLRETLFQLAHTKPAVAIFLAKNYLGMKDERSHVVAGDQERPIRHAVGYDLAKLPTAKLKTLRELLGDAEEEIVELDDDQDIDE